MYCSFCGKELPEGALFCPACGQEKEPTDGSGQETNTEAVVPPEQEGGVQTTDKSTEPGEKKIKFPVIALILAAAVAVWFFFFRSAAPKTLNSDVVKQHVIEDLTEKQVIRDLSDAGFEYAFEDVNEITVTVKMPDNVVENIGGYQIGNRYELKDRSAYGYEIDIPLQLYITVDSSGTDTWESYPIDIDVTGTVIYHKNDRLYGFDVSNVEYEDEFEVMLDTARILQNW